MNAHSSVADALSLDVFKSPTCGCCQKWIDHIELSGFKATAHDTDRLNQIKTDSGILPQYQSCHTAISENGFVFEGHIPAAIVKQFLDNPPKDAIGLAVPGMPMGSPGMEMGAHTCRDREAVFGQSTKRCHWSSRSWHAHGISRHGNG